MRTIIYILLFWCTILNSQVLNTKGNYAVIIVGDSLIVNEYIENIEVVTNANKVGGVAYEVDTINVLDSIDRFRSSLPALPNSGFLKKNTLYLYDDKVCRVLQNHPRTIYEPTETPALFLFREPGCSDWSQPTGGHDAYNYGDCIIFLGSKYKSTIENNVWSPSVYPAGWSKQ